MLLVGGPVAASIGERVDLVMIERGAGNLVRGLMVQLRVLRALMIRNLMLRYGRNNIGFLWVVLEPMLLTAGVIVIFSQVKSQYEHGTHVVSLVLSGYMPLTVWRHTTNSGVFLFRQSASILYHRNITLWDVFLAKMLLEGIGCTAAFVFVYGTLLAAGVVAPIAKPWHLMAAWCLLWWFGTAVALLIAAMTEIDESSERFIQPAQYLLVPLSGTFYMVDWVPRRAQDLLVFNPLTNCIEFFRDGFFGDEVTTHYDVSYAIIWALTLTWIGLHQLGRARTQLNVS